MGLIVPHAGYVYSGPVAASGYARLAPLRGGVRRVVVLGPAHFRSVATAAVPTAAAFRTPLGVVPVAVDGCTRLVKDGLAVAADGPHAKEHSLEVQLPFLQRTLGPGWSLLPIVVGAGGDVAELLAAVTDETPLVVCSTDLSHYLPHQQACARDRRTADAIIAGDADAIGPDDACGAGAVRALLRWAALGGLRIELLDLRTSARHRRRPITGGRLRRLHRHAMIRTPLGCSSLREQGDDTLALAAAHHEHLLTAGSSPPIPAE